MNTVMSGDTTTLGDNVRQARVAARLTQQELAEKAGVTQQTVAKIEAGAIKRSRRLPDVARALNSSSEVLLGGSPIAARSLDRVLPGQLAVAKQLLRFESPSVEWQDLGPADRDAFLLQAREVIAAYHGALA